ncbi:unnamed protein product, partial [Amoebophrya sp. A25]
VSVVAIAEGEKLSRKDKRSGKKLSDLLPAQCDHYSFLRSHSLRLAEMSPFEAHEHGTGTAGNEALHREVG